jgi:hypothetical protein
MSAPQSSKNHTRWDPILHFVIMPLLLVNLIFSIYIAVHYGERGWHMHGWLIVMSVVLMLMAERSRASALTVQNRVIRLEERLRLAALVSPAQALEMQALTTKQLVALRFASDAELPALARRALFESMTPKQIKESIVSWRADYERV